ncbi:MAG: hypothetical protein ACRBB4_12300 [Neptuniibacter sp.]
MNQEQLRHQYLEAIGISSWLPCAKLPGALESPEWVNDFQFPAPEIPFESDRTQARANLAQSRTALKEVGAETASQSIAALNKVIAPDTPVVAKEPVSKPVPHEPAAEVDVVESAPHVSENTTPPNFKIAFQKIGKALVIDSLPPQGGNFSANYQKLSSAIVNSLGISGEISEPFMLPWPIFASKTLDQSREQAVIAVQHKLNKELKKGEVSVVVLFGESAAQMVLDRDEPIDQLSGILLTLTGGVKTVACSSLTEAMQLPGIKKQIWMDLQPMLKHLNNK